MDRFGPPTWRKLVEIVEDPAAGNNKALADEIARKHLTRKEDGKTCFGNLALYLGFDIIGRLYLHSACMKLGNSLLAS